MLVLTAALVAPHGLEVVSVGELGLPEPAETEESFLGNAAIKALAAARAAGHRVIEGFRALAGTTDPTTAAPGTIRGDLGRDWGLKVQQNLVHGSDSPESAARELQLWFA